MPRPILLPGYWADLFAAPIDDLAARSAVIQEVRTILMHAPDAKLPLTTAELTEALWPTASAQGLNAEARKRMVNMVLALATKDLADCARKALKPNIRYGKPIYPWRWYSPQPDAVTTCPNCGHQY